METELSQTSVRIEKLVHGGEGLGRLPSGQVVFVPQVIPGEIASIALKDPTSKKPVHVDLITVQEASDERVDPLCNVFGQCGGCQWQHMGISTQRRWKAEVLTETLRRLGGLTNLPVQAIENTPDSQWHYRNKVEWLIGPDGEPGYHHKRTHDWVGFDHCWIIPDALSPFADWLTQYAREALKQLVRVRVRCNDQNQWLVLFIGESVGPEILEPLIEPMVKAFPAIRGIVFQDLAAKPSEPIVLWGDDYLMESLGSLSFRVSANSFFQVNRVVAQAMIAQLKQWFAAPVDSLLDLYCGVGLFSLSVADWAQQVVGVDDAPTAITDAQANAELQGVSHATFHHSDTAAFIRSCEETFEAAIVDPPRTGCPKPLLDWLAAQITSRIVYISCDPATLARDLKHLAQFNWCVVAIQPFDMFPQTYHVETMVLLEK